MTALTLPPALLPRIAVLGAGHVGPVIAQVALEAGYQVSIAASGHPEQIELIAQVLSPGAEPRWALDAVREANMVVLALPLHRFATLDPSLLDGKLVVDAMNYWLPVDGVVELFEDHRSSSSEIVQRRLAGSTVVKTLNHIGYIDEDTGEGVEVAHGREVAHQRTIEQELEFGMTVGSLSTGALAVNRLIEGTLPIEGDTHLGSGFPVEVFDAALALFELLVLTALSIGLRKEQGTAKALSALPVGVGELVGGMHAESNGTQGHAISSTLTLRMAVRVEGNGSDAPAKDHRLIDATSHQKRHQQPDRWGKSPDGRRFGCREAQHR